MSKSKFISFIIVTLFYQVALLGQVRQIIDGQNKIGFINEKNDTLFKCQFDWVQFKEFGGVAMKTCVVRTDNQFGLISAEGKFLTQMDYSKMYVVNSHHNFLGFEKQEKHGLMDLATGNIVLQPEFDTLITYSPYSQFFTVKKNGKFGIINKQFQVIVPCENDKLLDYAMDIYCFQKNEKVGFYDNKGKLIIPFVYDELGSIQFGEKRIRVKKNGKWGVIDFKGNENGAFKYDEIDIYFDGLARFSQNGKVGYLNLKGAEQLPPKYDEGDWFTEGLCFVGNKDKDGVLKYALIDKKGQNITAFIFDDFLNLYDNGYSMVKSQDKFGIIDLKGKFILPVIYDSSEIDPEFYVNDELYVLLKTKDLLQLYDKKGKAIFQTNYDEMDEVEIDVIRGVVQVKRNNQVGFVQLNDGREIIPCQFSRISPFEFENYNYLLVEQLDKKGVWSIKENRLIVACEFDEVHEVYRDYGPSKSQDLLFFVTINEKLGLWNASKNRIVIPCEYDRIDFPDELQTTQQFILANKSTGSDEENKPDRSTLFNQEGKIILAERIITELYVLRDKKDQYLVVYDFVTEKYGLFSLDGAELLPCIYTEINAVKKGMVYVDVDGVSKTIPLPKKK